MRPEHVVVVPSTLTLLPEYAGIEDPLPELRAAARCAVGWLVERHPEAISVIAAPPRSSDAARGITVAAGLRVGQQLLAEAGFTGRHHDPSSGLLVVANGSACRSEKAPGHLDPRAFDFDDEIDRAVRSGVPESLRDLDESLGHELWAHDVTAWRELGERVSGGVTAQVDHADDPYGVQYWVARWTCVS